MLLLYSFAILFLCLASAGRLAMTMWPYTGYFPSRALAYRCLRLHFLLVLVLAYPCLRLHFLLVHANLCLRLHTFACRPSTFYGFRLPSCACLTVATFRKPSCLCSSYPLLALTKIALAPKVVKFKRAAS